MGTFAASMCVELSRPVGAAGLEAWTGTTGSLAVLPSRDGLGLVTSTGSLITGEAVLV